MMAGISLPQLWWLPVSLVFSWFVYLIASSKRRKPEGEGHSFPIVVRLDDRENIRLSLSPDATVAAIKEQIGRRRRRTGNLSILFAGKLLPDSFRMQDSDIGRHSIVHAVNTERAHSDVNTNSALLSISLKRLQLPDGKGQSGCQDWSGIHFFIYCSSHCHAVSPGKLRVRCSLCKQKTLLVNCDPTCWDDVLIPNRITGICLADGCSGQTAEFFFKCAGHDASDDEPCIVLHYIRPNIEEVPCLACLDVSTPILMFPCRSEHSLCLSCFQAYCLARLDERHFVQNPDIGYTLPCPVGCENSLIRETYHFHLLGEEQYARYQRFAAEEYVLQSGGVLCPQPGCGSGLEIELSAPDCRRVTCIKEGGVGCGFVFCRLCLQGYHIGECEQSESLIGNSACDTELPNNDVALIELAASKVAIRVTTKPCPKCRTPTERDGGCMHMICTRPNCGFHWCWVCQVEWTYECMGNHWFG